jgi:transcriptional regulator GlxA family with amidase domain
MIAVVLQPYSLFTHFHTSAYELNNNTVALADLFGQEARDTEEQVVTALTIDTAIGIIEKFLLKRLMRLNRLSSDMALAMDFICQHQGIITIDSLLRTVPVTERQLERKFREYIGTSPKRFADTIKFQHLLKLLQRQPDQDKIAELIYKSGYYDHAHLNNNFKKMTGLTPNHYKDTPRMLAINLMPIN